MQAGYTTIVVRRDMGAHRFCGHAGFFRHGQIARTGCDDGDMPGQLGGFCAPENRSRDGAVGCVFHRFCHRVRHLLGGACGEHCFAAVGEVRKSPHDLFDGFG